MNEEKILDYLYSLYRADKAVFENPKLIQRVTNAAYSRMELVGQIICHIKGWKWDETSAWGNARWLKDPTRLMNVKMAGFDAAKEAAELEKRQKEILAGYGYRLHDVTGKAYKFVPVPEDYFRVSDGGRLESGDKRVTEFHGTCVVRSFAIALYGPHPTGKEYHNTYREICDAIRDWAMAGKSNALKRLYRDGTRHCKPDHMPHNDVVTAYAESKGFVWTATAGIGQVETVHVRPDELPGGSLVLKISKAYTAMVDGILYDTWDTSVSRHVATDDGRGWRMVYGYWAKG